MTIYLQSSEQERKETHSQQGRGFHSDPSHPFHVFPNSTASHSMQIPHPCKNLQPQYSTENTPHIPHNLLQESLVRQLNLETSNLTTWPSQLVCPAGNMRIAIEQPRAESVERKKAFSKG